MDSLIIKRAEQRIRQQVFGGVVMFVCALMILNTFNLLKVEVFAGNSLNADVTFNITSGTLALTNGPTAIAFGSNAFGATGNIRSANEADNVVAQDYRGTYTAWSVSVVSTDLNSSGSLIYANKIKLYQDTAGVLTNIQNCDTNQVAKGANGTLNGTGVTLMNGSTNASGIVQFDNGYFNLTLGGAEAAGTYTGKITFTLI